MILYKRKGFTLIELLVVIAIIAILAAILFPVFARAREKARQASCQSNLKELVLAWQMYAQDFDEMPVPDSICDPGGTAMSSHGRYWCSGMGSNKYNDTGIPKGLLYPYIKNAQVFYCPSRGGSCPDGDGSSYHYGINRQGAVSWMAYNNCTGYIIVAGLSDYESPAQTICMGDGGTSYHCIRRQAANYPCDRHNGFANISFVDGHVKARKLSELLGSVGCCWTKDCSY